MRRPKVSTGIDEPAPPPHGGWRRAVRPRVLLVAAPVAIALVLAARWAALGPTRPTPPDRFDARFAVVVIDATDGRPLPGASVTLGTGSDGTGSVGTARWITDADGRVVVKVPMAARTTRQPDGTFRRTGPVETEYSLLASAPGYGPIRLVPGTLDPKATADDPPVPVRISLLPDPTPR